MNIVSSLILEAERTYLSFILKRFKIRKKKGSSFLTLLQVPLKLSSLFEDKIFL